MGGWVGQWLGSCQITKFQINLDLIEVNQFCLKIYGDTPTYGLVYGWLDGTMGGSMDGVTSNH